jgi:hypothetical protein
LDFFLFEVAALLLSRLSEEEFDSVGMFPMGGTKVEGA